MVLKLIEESTFRLTFWGQFGGGMEAVAEQLRSSPALALAAACGVATAALLAAGAPAPAASKPYATFAAFYPFYLTQHSQAGTRRLHVLGTLLMLGQVVATPELLLSLLAAGCVGMAAFAPLRGQASGLLEFALVLATYGSLGSHLCGSWQRTLAVPASAYACAWLGHFFVEHNRPATFIYPTFSLLGDLRLFYDIARGALTC